MFIIHNLEHLLCVYIKHVYAFLSFFLFFTAIRLLLTRIYALLLLLLFVPRSFIICLNFRCKRVHNTIIFSVMNTQNRRTRDIPSKSNYAERFMRFTYINGCFHFKRP